MIRPMMLWGMELAWRTEGLAPPHPAEEQRTGWTMMQRVEAAAATKITGAYRCASTEKVLAIAGIEPLHIKLASMQARYVARTLANPAAAGKLMPANWQGAGPYDPNADRQARSRLSRQWNQAFGNGYTYHPIPDGYTSILGATASKSDQGDKNLHE